MRILITGATGFLGGAVARFFASTGEYVTATGRDRDKGALLAELGMRFEACALEDAAAAHALCAEQDVVVHCAGLSSPWGSYDTFYRANVLATRNVVAGCRAHGVSRLVNISTPSFYMSGVDRENIREHDPLPRPVNHYAATKLLAEREVDAAEGLSSISLRPRAIFGPGDTTIFPRLLRTLATGRLPVVGSGENWVDLTYIDNVVQAIALAVHAPAGCAGGKYNVTNGEPVQLWPLVRQLAEQLSLPPPRGRVPYLVARGLAQAAELVHRTLALGEPRMTAYTVQVLALTMTLDISAARTELGYRPDVAMGEGLARFVRWYKA